MAEKLLRGHHVKNLSHALNFSWLDSKNRRSLSYIIDGDSIDDIIIIENESDGVCEWCEKNEPESFETCPPMWCQDGAYDKYVANLFHLNIGETYKAKDLIKKLRSSRIYISAFIKYLKDMKSYK